MGIKILAPDTLYTKDGSTTKPPILQDFRAMDVVIANNVELLANMNKVVFQMQQEAEQKVARMVKIQTVAIGSGVLIVIISIFAIKASVIAPIKSLYA